MCAPRPRALAAAALAGLLAACGAPGGGAPADALSPEVAPPPAPTRAVFFGSSTTAGSGATRRERRWTTLVSARLGWIEVNRGLAKSLLTEIGRKTPSGEARWREALAGPPPDVVVVMYGANDVLAHVPLGDAATPGTFRHAAAAVLRGIREAVPDAALVVCTPQPSRATADRRELYDLALAEAAAGVGAHFVVAGSAFPAERLGQLAADRLHLNDAGHAVLAEFFLAHRGTLSARPGAESVAIRR